LITEFFAKDSGPLDDVKATTLAGNLVGQQLDGWTIEKLIDHGKSAAVFSANKNSQLAAVKIFDTELIERNCSRSCWQHSAIES
jgi:serine/threonine-protein kinase RIO1